MGFSAFCRYSRRICATSAMEGHSTTDSPPGGDSSSTMRREMRVLPVPQGRMILPRAWPMGMPSASVSSWPLNLLTTELTASFCIQVLDCLRHSPSGLGWQ